MKKTLALVLALLMVVTCFVACGKKDEDDNNAPVVSTPDANTSTASGDSSVVSGDISVADSSVEDSSVEDSSVEDSSVEDSSVADANSIVGAWSGVAMDYAELMVAAMEGAAGTEFTDFTYTPVEVVITYNFKADGTVEGSVNTDEIATGLDKFIDELATYLAAMDGSSKDEMAATLREQMDIDAAVAELENASATGTYTVDGNELTITSEVDGETSVEEGVISGNQIVINSEGIEVTLTKK